MKRVLIAAATAAALSLGALAAPASAAPASADIVKVHGPGQWNNGKGQWNHGQKWNGGKKWHAQKSCEPIVRWRMVGPHWKKHWKPVVVGWDCGRRHHRW